MKFINPLILLSENGSTTNEVGDSVISYSERKVYAHEEDIKQSEFYQAQAVGMKPEVRLIIRGFEYKNEVLAIYKCEKYKILRTYKRNDNNLEIILTRGINNGDS